MADLTTEDTIKNQQAGEDAGSSNDAMVIDVSVNQLPLVDLKDPPDPKDMGKSPHLEDLDVKMEMIPQCDNGDNSAETLMLEPGLPEEKDSLQSPGVTKNIELGSNNHEVDGTDEDDSSQQDSVILKERSFEVKVKDEKVQQPNDRATGVELPADGTKELDTNISTPLESSAGLCSNIEIKDKRMNKEKKHGLEITTENEEKKELGNALTKMDVKTTNDLEGELGNAEHNVQHEEDMKTATNTFVLDKNDVLVDEPETEEDQAAFMKELEAFHKVRCLEFKPPKFYGEPLNCLKLWRAVIRLGGYEQVTACKLWRQVGESFNPPKTCTTVSWTFRGFYEKALLEYEKHKMRNGELPFNDASFTEPSSIGTQAGLSQASGSGRARRDAAARAMQGWHTQRLLGNGEVGDPIIKDRNSVSMAKREKQLKSVGLLKRKKPSPVDPPLEVARLKASKLQLETMVVDIGPPADWVKINVQKTKDCFEVYALVPGLLREEVRVQSDPAGRLVITGQPEQLDNPWGVTPFKKVVSLPSRIDPHQTSAVVTLHGQLFVRVPFEQSDM